MFKPRISQEAYPNSMNGQIQCESLHQSCISKLIQRSCLSRSQDVMVTKDTITLVGPVENNRYGNKVISEI